MACLRRLITRLGTRRTFATTTKCASRVDSLPPPDPELDGEALASSSSAHDTLPATPGSSPSSSELLSAVSAAATLTTAIPAFVPRTSPPLSASLPRSYFLGHHASALSTMRNQLASINLVLEARDYRVPISSMNAELDRALAGRPRIIIYTKADLCRRQRGMESFLKRWHAEHRHSVATVFHSSGSGGKSGGKTGAGRSSHKLLAVIKSVLNSGAIESSPVLGARALVVGLPNAGKSTLLNLLRSAGMQDSLFVGDKGTRTVRRAGKTIVLHKKAARTAANPGVTRKLSAPVRILPKAPSSAETEDVDKDDGGVEEPFNTGNNGLFIVDTPGVFLPFVSSPETMVKLSLAGAVKDGIVDSEILCDYLLYRINLLNPKMYEKYCDPTNDVIKLLKRIAEKTGKILKGGKPNIEAAANWMIQQWRTGRFGDIHEDGNWKGGKTGGAGFVLDDVTKETLMEAQRALDSPEISATQAKKREKLARLEKIMGRAAGGETDVY